MTARKKPIDPPYRPTRGELVTDHYTGRTGTFQAKEGNSYFLRPLGGGIEWTADPLDVKPATQAEALSAKVALANRQSRLGADLC